ncbi:tyrosine-type recombinase/integrase [Thiotrichales bacterium 19X7-9]|nr:tyrosine-type recombinase/integrase [Thiotrichales bacterium 19X7-9]
MNELTPKNNDLIKQNIEDELKHALELEKLSKSHNTIKRYQIAYKIYHSYCGELNVDPIPAQPEVLYTFFSFMHRQKYALTTIFITKSAIEYFHKQANFAAATNHPRIEILLEGIRRDLASQSKASMPVLYEEIRLIIDAITNKSLVDYRDKALILLGFAAGFRPSELVSLHLSDLNFVSNGVEILLQQSKVDKYKKGHTIAIPYNIKNPPYCPITAIKEWITNAAINDGALFRGFYKGYKKIRNTPLTYRGYFDVFKQRTLNAGLMVDMITPHGLRSGFNTSAADAGADLHKMREITNQSLLTQQRYIKQTNLFKNNAIEKIFNKNK